MNEIKFSKKASLKLMEIMFSKYYSNWFITTVNWLIDSKWRKYKWLNKWLEEQVRNPAKNVKLLAARFKGIPYDKRIVKIQEYILSRKSYVTDSVLFGKADYWQTTKELIERDFIGDCDDLNTAVYVLARVSGMPKYIIYNALVDTSSGFHYTAFYLSTTQGKVYSIDCTFFSQRGALKNRNEFTISFPGYTNIRFVFNEEYCFKQK